MSKAVYREVFKDAKASPSSDQNASDSRSFPVASVSELREIEILKEKQRKYLAQIKQSLLANGRKTGHWIWWVYYKFRVLTYFYKSSLLLKPS